MIRRWWTSVGQANPSSSSSYSLLTVWGGGGRARGRGFEEVEESFESGRAGQQRWAAPGRGAIGRGDPWGADLTCSLKPVAKGRGVRAQLFEGEQLSSTGKT